MMPASLLAISAMSALIGCPRVVPPVPPIVFFNLDDSCTNPEKSLLEATRVTVFVPGFVNNASNFDACVQDAFISADKGLSVERILGLMREPFNTSIGCKDNFTYQCSNEQNNWASCAGSFSPGSNALNLSHEFLCGCSGQCNGVPCSNPAAGKSVAGNILHGIAHNKNFEHDDNPFEAGITVNNQLAACIGGGPTLARRSSLTREVELAHIGGHGGGGVPKESFCYQGWPPVPPPTPFGFVAGLKIQTSAGDAEVQFIKPICASVAGGTRWDGSPIFPSSQTGVEQYESACPVGSFVTGLIGRNGDVVNSIAVTCSSLADISNGTSRNTPQLPPFGGGGGIAFQRRCPPGMAITGFFARSGDVIDQLRPVCRQIAVGTQPASRPTQIVGRTEGVQEDLRCTGQGAMVGIYGRAGSLVDRVGGICRSLQQTPSGLADAGKSTEHATAAGLEASRGGKFFEDRCSPGSALVGFSTRSGESLDQLAGICAGINQWATGSPTSPPAACTPATCACTMDGSAGNCRHGESGGHPNPDLVCPPPEFVVGLETWRNEPSFQSGVVVRGFRPICRRLPLADLTATLTITKLGSGQVTAKTFACDPTCNPALPLGGSVTLLAVPSTMWRFDHWEGACSGSNASCTVGPLTGNESVKAVFVAAPGRATLMLTAVNACPAPGSGTVTSTPSLITCSSDATCTASVALGTSLTLSATPAGNTIFRGFSGDCTSSGTSCPLTVNATKTVVATFCGVIP